MSKASIDLPNNLSQPARRALASLHIDSLNQLTEISKKSLAKYHGIGPKTIRQLEEALSEHGLQFLTK